MTAEPPRRKPDGPLKKGWTTGACAAGAAAAAFRGAHTGAVPVQVTIRLPKGETPTFGIEDAAETHAGWRAAIVKDAGDDPDVTHGAKVVVLIRPLKKGAGIVFKAGEGVGTVTLPGLPLDAGEPAINPGPRAIITDAIETVAGELGVAADAEVTISIPGGEELAEKTMNGRLGIKGGLSVLGTTGVVIPYSCASWINSIHRGVDVAHHQGIEHLIAATGSTSETAAMRDFPDLPVQAYIDMGDFAGGLLKYLRRRPVPLLTIVGGFGKLAKLAQGHLDLHSKSSRLDMAKLADSASEAGADKSCAARVAEANTGMEALSICTGAAVPLAGAVARGARETVMAALAGETEVTVRVYDRAGALAGRSDGG